MRNSELYVNLNASIAFLCQILKAILLSDIKLFTWGWCFATSFILYFTISSVFKCLCLYSWENIQNKQLTTSAHNATSVCYLPAGTTLTKTSLLFHINDGYGRRFSFHCPKTCCKMWKLLSIGYSQFFKNFQNQDFKNQTPLLSQEKVMLLTNGANFLTDFYENP